MIVSHKKKFIYFHIPKTGGSSLAWNLKNYIDFSGEVKNLKRGPGWQKTAHYDSRQHSTYSDNITFCKNYKHYFTFAFVRNPWDLTFSWFLARNGSTPNKITKEGFNSYLFNYIQKYNIILNPLRFFKKYSNKGFKALNKTQLSYISDQNGLIQIDYVAKFENYDSEIQYIQKKLNIISQSNEKVNVANFQKLNYKNFYCDKGARLIEKLFEDDIKAFDYRF